MFPIPALANGTTKRSFLPCLNRLRSFRPKSHHIHHLPQRLEGTAKTRTAYRSELQQTGVCRSGRCRFCDRQRFTASHHLRQIEHPVPKVVVFCGKIPCGPRSGGAWRQRGVCSRLSFRPPESPGTSGEPNSTRTASNSLRTLLRRSIWAARRLQTSRMGSHHVGNEQSPTKSLLRKPHATGRGSRRPRPPFPGSKQPGFEISSRLKKKRKPWIVKRLCRRTAGGSLKTGADEMMTTLADIQDSKTPRLQDS